MLKKVNTRETAPLSDAEIAVWREFVDGGWALMARISSGFSAAGESNSDLHLLDIVVLHDAIGISELAAEMHAGVSTVSRAVSRLVNEGELERVPSQSDARRRFVRITDHGRDKLQSLALLRDSIIRTYVIDVLSEDELENLGKIFAKIGHACS